MDQDGAGDNTQDTKIESTDQIDAMEITEETQGGQIKTKDTAQPTRSYVSSNNTGVLINDSSLETMEIVSSYTLTACSMFS